MNINEMRKYKDLLCNIGGGIAPWHIDEEATDEAIVLSYKRPDGERNILAEVFTATNPAAVDDARFIRDAPRMVFDLLHEVSHLQALVERTNHSARQIADMRDERDALRTELDKTRGDLSMANDECRSLEDRFEGLRERIQYLADRGDFVDWKTITDTFRKFGV